MRKYYYSKDENLMLQKYILTVEKVNFIVNTREIVYHKSITNNDT
jgi:hypothetical protein